MTFTISLHDTITGPLEEAETFAEAVAAREDIARHIMSGDYLPALRNMYGHIDDCRERLVIHGPDGQAIAGSAIAAHALVSLVNSDVLAELENVATLATTAGLLVTAALAEVLAQAIRGLDQHAGQVRELLDEHVTDLGGT